MRTHSIDSIHRSWASRAGEGTIARRFLLTGVVATLLVGCGTPQPEPMPEPAAAAAVQETPEPAGAFASETIHIGVVASDLEASLRFYEEVVGMQRVSSFSLDEDFGRRSGLTGGVPVTVQVLQLGSGETATQWKVMSFGDRPAPQENAFIYDHVGMQYITLLLNDLAPVLERLEAHGIPLLGETPTALDDGRRFILVQDPDGTFIELIGK